MYNRRYDKIFLMLRQDAIGYSVGKQMPWGSCVIEIKNGAGKIQITVQGLRPTTYSQYEVYMIGREGQKTRSIFCGEVVPDAKGQGQLKWEFNPNHIANQDLTVEEVHTIAIIVQKGQEIATPLVAYVEGKKQWKPYFKTIRVDEKTVVEEKNMMAAEACALPKIEMELIFPKKEEVVLKTIESEIVDTQRIEAEIIELKAVESKRIEPKAIEPKAIEPKAIELKVIEPKAIEPKAIEPKAIEPKVIAPKAIEPKAIEPKAIEPKAIEPKVIAPKAIEPKAIEPKAIEPKAIELKVIEPKVIEPKVIELKVTEPKRIEPQILEVKKIEKQKSKENIKEETKEEIKEENYHGSFRGLLKKFQQELQELNDEGIFNRQDMKKIQDAGELVEQNSGIEVPSIEDQEEIQRHIEEKIMEEKVIDKKVEEERIVQEKIVEEVAEQKIPEEKVIENIDRSNSILFEENINFMPFSQDETLWKCITLDEFVLLEQFPLEWQKRLFFLYPMKKYQHFIYKEKDGIWTIGVPSHVAYDEFEKQEAKDLGFSEFYCMEKAEVGYWIYEKK